MINTEVALNVFNSNIEIHTINHGILVLLLVLYFQSSDVIFLKFPK